MRSDSSGLSRTTVWRTIRWAPALLAALGTTGCGFLKPPDAASARENIALGCSTSLVGGHGDPAVATDGRLDAEGTAGSSQTVVFDSVRSALVVDLGEERPVGALLLQAGPDDVYVLEASTDGSMWRVLWWVPPMHGAQGLRTRMTTLPSIVSLRWLRVRPTTLRAATVSEVQAFATQNPTWPHLDDSRPEAALPLWPSLTRERATALYQALATLLVLGVGWSALARWCSADAFGRRTRKCVLGVLAAASLAAWPNFLNFHYYGFVHGWEFFHYYLGAKYLPELGYTCLYTCAVGVDAEDGLDLGSVAVRDLRDNTLVSPARALERFAECRARFAARRWEEFRQDARFFRAVMGGEAWTAVRHDHGFNATPAWAVLAAPLTRPAPASRNQLLWLALLDVLLLGAIFVVVFRTFGLEAGCVAAGFFGVNALSEFGWTGGGFLRYDWLFWLVVGIAASRGQRPLLAGFALGYSALLRVFPACAIAGVALNALAECATARSIRPLARRARFGVGVAASAILLFSATTVMTGRARIWQEFIDNSARHLTTEAVNFIGTGVFLAHEHEARLEILTDPLLPDPHAPWKAHLAAAERGSRAAQWGAGAGFVLLLAIAARGRPDWVAATLGVGLMPMLLKLSSYYYAALLVYAALWPLSAATGFALILLGWLTRVAMAFWSGGDEPYAWLSLAVVAFVVGVTGLFAWHGRASSMRATDTSGGGQT